MNAHPRFAALAAALSVPLLAQGPGVPVTPDAASQMNVQDVRIPIGTQSTDPIGGAYGTWAAGPTYKVSFHDGYAFYPVLGERYPENLPLRWQTERVTVGGADLFAPGVTPRHSHTDWQYRYDYETVTEVYDVKPEGVAQSFVVHQRPASRGDLVVHGRMTTKLRAAAVAMQHAALTFHDEAGNPILNYSEAYGIDAHGRRFPMQTSYDGERVQLTLAAHYADEAAFPLTVDPLTARVAINLSLSDSPVFHPEIGRDDESNQVMIAWSRVSAGSDYDCFVLVCNDTFGGVTNIYSDITASWSTLYPQVAFVGGANKWITCIQRTFPSQSVSAVRFLFSPSGSTAVVNTVTFPSLPAGYDTARLPDVGGTESFSSGNNALMVFQADITATNANTANTEVFGYLINAAAETYGTAFRIDPSAVGATFDREFPAINQVSGGGTDSWIVAYQEFNNTIANDDWDITITRISNTGTRLGTNFLGAASDSDHALTPRVEGSNGRYMATFAQRQNLGTKYSGSTGTAMQVERFNWTGASGTAPTKLQRRTAQGSIGGSALLSTGNIAYDTNDDSHWVITYQQSSGGNNTVIAERVGYTGGTVEQATAYSSRTYSGRYPAVTFNNDAREFQITFATTEVGAPLYAVRLQYGASANTLYGTGCGTGVIGVANSTGSGPTIPHAGFEFFRVQLTGAPVLQAAALLIAGNSANLPLNVIGMPAGCFLNVDTTPGLFLTSLGTTTNGSGAAGFSFPLPDAPVVVGDIYFQWVYANPALANPLKLQTTRGLRTQIR